MLRIFWKLLDLGPHTFFVKRQPFGLTAYLRICSHRLHCRRGECTLPILTVRNLPEETHRALRHRAAEHGRSTEAEVRSILEEAVRPQKRMKIGTALLRIGQEVGGMDDLEIIRDRMRSGERTSNDPA